MMEFKTLSGNEYVYLQESGIIYPKKAFEQRSAEIERFEKSLIGSVINLDEINPEVIKELLFRYGLQELILETTQRCNLRCKYCFYSEVYPTVRDAGLKDMSEDIAMKAIDFYLSLLREGRAYNPYRDPTIGFYGGEPLLNFKLIKKCIQYVAENCGDDFDPHFTITTNSTLLSEEIVSFLSEYNCGIIVSLDGPKEEHDSKRVFPSGEGSFDTIMGNLKPLSDQNPEVYILGEDGLNIYSLAVYDIKTDLEKVNEFFYRRDVPILMRAGPVNSAVPTTYFYQFTKEDFEAYVEKIRKMYHYQIEKIGGRRKGGKGSNRPRPSLYELDLMNAIVEILNRPIGKYRSPYIPYSGSGVPGFKMFADCNGLIRICERSWADATIIGDVESGLDYERILGILKSLRSVTPCCESCIAKNMCSLCYTTFAVESTLELNPIICENTKMRLEGVFSHLWTIGEIDDTLFDRLSDEYYTFYKGIGKEFL